MLAPVAAAVSIRVSEYAYLYSLWEEYRKYQLGVTKKLETPGLLIAGPTGGGIGSGDPGDLKPLVVPGWCFDAFKRDCPRVSESGRCRDRRQADCPTGSGPCAGASLSTAPTDLQPYLHCQPAPVV